MDQLLEVEIRNVCTSSFCHLCVVKISSTSVERSHYSCKRHLESVASYRSELLKKWEAKKITKNMNSLGPSPANHCSLCHKSFDTGPAFTEHKQIYPHQPLAELKSELVKKGILKEYWTVQSNGFVVCTICKAQLQTNNSMLAHIKSFRHKGNLQSWCQAYKTDQLLDDKTCNTKVDGWALNERDSTEFRRKPARQSIPATRSIQQNHDEIQVTPDLSPERDK